MKVKPQHPNNALNLPYKLVTLSQGQFAIVDAEDFGAVSKFNWYARRDRCTKSFYAVRSIRGGEQKEQMHKFIMNLHGIDTGERTVDHVNRNSLDNRFSNLRLATPSEQNCNKRKQSRNNTGYTGVMWDDESKLYTASIGIDSRLKNLGSFDDPFSAAWVRDEAAKKIHGDFAVTNLLVDRRQARDRRGRRMQRKRRANKSGFTGVTWNKSARKWKAYLRIDGRQKYLGSFDDPYSAALARDKALIDLYGPFAVTNGLIDRRQSSRRTSNQPTSIERRTLPDRRT